jgi:GNAT superfamily N-acetyltransferase
MGMTIRPAEYSDIETMAELLCELFTIESDFAPEPTRHRRGLRSLLKQPSNWRILVAEDNGQVVGMCSLHILTSTAEGEPVGIIEDVIVKTGFRKRGIGRFLVEAVETMAWNLGLNRLQLLTDSGNSSAIFFYKHLGWRSTQLICLRRRRGSNGVAGSIPIRIM